MRSRRSHARSFAALALAAGALAGCGRSTGAGIASRAPAQILAAARFAGTHAATVRVSGSILRGGKPISLYMELVSEKGGAGQVALEGLRVRLIGLDRLLYVSGDSALYERLAGRAAAPRLRGVWLKGLQSSPALHALASLTSLRELVGDVLDDHGALVRDGVSSIRGQRAVGVSDRAGGGTVYVAASGVPYPLEIVWNGAAEGTLSFEDWNEPATITPPASPVTSVQRLQAHR
jgi:hypothetical protein